MRKFKFRWIVLALVAAPFVYNLDAFYGSWKFSRLCKNEGGPRYYSAVERNVGWLVDDSLAFSYQRPFSFKDVAFVRWKNGQGEWFDVYIDWNVRNQPYPRKFEYDFRPVDQSKPVRYQHILTSSYFNDDARFSRASQQIFDLKEKKISASYTTFVFQWAKPERVILSAPTGVGCWDGQTREEQQVLASFYQNIFGSSKLGK